MFLVDTLILLTGLLLLLGIEVEKGDILLLRDKNQNVPFVWPPWKNRPA